MISHVKGLSILPLPTQLVNRRRTVQASPATVIHAFKEMILCNFSTKACTRLAHVCKGDILRLFGCEALQSQLLGSSWSGPDAFAIGKLHRC